MNNALVHCTGLSKVYGPVRALDNVELSLSPGKIVGLLVNCHIFSQLHTTLKQFPHCFINLVDL